jgi:hypothetical protein
MLGVERLAFVCHKKPAYDAFLPTWFTLAVYLFTRLVYCNHAAFFTLLVYLHHAFGETNLDL